MAENKKSILFYVDWGETFDQLPDQEAGKLIKHLCDYVRDKNPKSDSILINSVFANMKNTLKRDLNKWHAKSEKNRENANKRWNKENANAYERIKTDAKNADRDTVTDSDIDKVKEKDSNKIEFDLFWVLYDKKVDKVKCEAKWKKLSKEIQQKILDYLPDYVKSTPNKDFRKNPATFLNNKSWENEIILKNSNTFKPHQFDLSQVDYEEEF